MFYVEPTLWVNGFPLRTPLGEGHLGTLESTSAEACILVRSFLSAPPSPCHPPCCSPRPYPAGHFRAVERWGLPTGEA